MTTKDYKKASDILKESDLDLSVTYVELILCEMRRKHILLSSKGPNGGYKRIENTITLLELHEALHGIELLDDTLYMPILTAMGQINV